MERDYRMKIYMVSLLHRATIKKLTERKHIMLQITVLQALWGSVDVSKWVSV